MLKSKSTLASVIIPTYNRAEIIQYTLNSLVNQTESKDNFEVIVADDGSFDNTASVVDSFRNRLNIKYFFQDDKGYRVGSARNMGIKNSSGGICIFVDSGVILGSNCIAAHISSHTNSSIPLAVIGYVYCFDQGNTHGEVLKQLINYANPDETIDHLKQNERFLDLREEFYTRYTEKIGTLLAPWVLFWTCNVSVPRSVLDDVGHFDPVFDGNWGVEDLELGYRVHKSGVTFVLNRTAGSIHYPHEKDEEKKVLAEVKNKIHFNNKFNSLETQLFMHTDWIGLNQELESQTKLHKESTQKVSPAIE